MKKSLRPQQAAPVQRPTTATSSAAAPGASTSFQAPYFPWNPFAGDDAE
jgi:prenylated cyclic peptide (anacyclamide/piricyclamide family)